MNSALRSVPARKTITPTWLRTVAIGTQGIADGSATVRASPPRGAYVTQLTSVVRQALACQWGIKTSPIGAAIKTDSLIAIKVSLSFSTGVASGANPMGIAVTSTRSSTGAMVTAFEANRCGTIHRLPPFRTLVASGSSPVAVARA